MGVLYTSCGLVTHGIRSRVQHLPLLVGVIVIREDKTYPAHT